MCLSFLYTRQNQSRVPIGKPDSNFAWDENDTSRYEGHYRYEQAYKLIEDMLSDKRPLDFAEAVFAVEIIRRSDLGPQ